MDEWREVLIGVNATIHEAIKEIDRVSSQIVLVVDEQRKLLGTVTDGDIRRGILRGLSYEESVTKIMKSNPVTTGTNVSKSEILELMQINNVAGIPILNKKDQVVGIEFLDRLLSKPTQKENIVVLMAGGLGSRLRPLTEKCPKPMLLIGGRPLMEIILLNFIEHGFHRFYISLNYKADVIEAYFKDGSKWGVEIQYLREKEKMGTAGSLSMLPKDVVHESVIVMNADLLTRVNFNQFLDFHLSQQSTATMAIRKYEFQMPYGAVTTNNYHIVSIDEKPVQQFFVNAGMYILSPNVLGDISDSYCDMTSLFQNISDKGFQTVAFPIREYWLDVGEIKAYRQGEIDYSGDGTFEGKNNWKGAQ